ncbi:MAG: M48 family metallopeptidase [Holophagales bacterium]|nr:M48 family metallopeptidase [Holophagales bacterium]MXX63040.1 M48 family metallopeptidase [Holophagales bacterium]MYC08818.1 M48 family metallopeptidase [Holophagales bacterium]MYD21100.1 M48 family metallopeptidase [Holophagales bacterium]MYI33140.1 M48 family metallopeptidase [Holophagales bacterium]
MNAVACRYYDGKSSRRKAAALTFTDAGDLIVDGAELEERLVYRDVRIPNRVADTPRFIHLPDGAVCEVQDNDALDELRVRLRRDDPEPRRDRFWRLVHRLDSTWRGAAAALAVVATVMYSFTRWGAPAVASLVVATTPQEAEALLGQNGLNLLRQLEVLETSALEPNRRNDLLAAFEEMKREAGVEHADLQFYSLGAPNAFALPGGTVVVTDELVEFAEHDEEIIAVLAHELGHVEGRHVLRSMAQRSTLLALWTAVTGDVSLAALSVLGPDQLIAQSYSRDFERAADEFAADYLLRAGVSPTRLGDILERLERESGTGSFPTWLSSHPAAADRARSAMERAGDRDEPGP